MFRLMAQALQSRQQHLSFDLDDVAHSSEIEQGTMQR